ncbi:hypothetical protein PFISCL1PPCAC_5812, partial [Pristionchus fissidentatus]
WIGIECDLRRRSNCLCLFLDIIEFCQKTLDSDLKSIVNEFFEDCLVLWSLRHSSLSLRASSWFLLSLCTCVHLSSVVVSIIAFFLLCRWLLSPCSFGRHQSVRMSEPSSENE